MKKAEEAKKDHREGAKDEQKADDEAKKEEEIPELPPRKDFQSPLTKPTCVDYCYNEGCVGLASPRLASPRLASPRLASPRHTVPFISKDGFTDPICV